MNRRSGQRPALVGVAMIAVLVASACSGNETVKVVSSEQRRGTIPQPVVGDLQVAPKGARVDLTQPTFSDPTSITNPLFPVSRESSNLLLGTVDGNAFRTEVTVLPDTRIIQWGGQRIEALVSQYAAFLDGRIHEVAYDFYAQADDGSVWYLGEDVLNFKDGAIADTHGTWIAGNDGPAAMIMPAHPKVGDVYRPENIPGFVFEEVTVTSVDQTLDGPLGPVEGGLAVTELHMDGSMEDKTFAPGYGEFYTASGKDVEAMGLSVPTDAAPGPTPEELTTLSTGGLEVFEMAAAGDWSAATETIERMSAAWRSARAGEVPAMLEPRMTRALEMLSRAVDAPRAAEARQAAIDVTQWALDLQLRSRPVAEVDLARFDLWLAQLQVHAQAGDAAAMSGDFFALDYLRDRILDQLDDADATGINIGLEDLLGPVGDGDFAAAADAADALRGVVAGR